MLLAVAAAVVAGLVIGVLAMLVLGSREGGGGGGEGSGGHHATPEPELNTCMADLPWCTGETEEEWERRRRREQEQLMREARERCACTDARQPVCALRDGYYIEYQNACKARCEQVTQWAEGTCAPVRARGPGELTCNADLPQCTGETWEQWEQRRGIGRR